LIIIGKPPALLGRFSKFDSSERWQIPEMMIINKQFLMQLVDNSEGSIPTDESFYAVV
jgi:hypothetical protein